MIDWKMNFRIELWFSKITWLHSYPMTSDLTLGVTVLSGQSCASVCWTEKFDRVKQVTIMLKVCKICDLLLL